MYALNPEYRIPSEPSNHFAAVQNADIVLRIIRRTDLPTADRFRVFVKNK